MTIPTHLIENALNLTGKKIGDIQELKGEPTHCETYQFSIEKFSYFLLSPEFIEKYVEKTKSEFFSIYPGSVASSIGIGIYQYQRKDKEFPDGNPGPLISLLEKIPGTHTL